MQWNGSQGRPVRQWLDDVKEWITRKASKTVVGRCNGMDHKEGQQDTVVGRRKGMDHEEGQQDSGWTM